MRTPTPTGTSGALLLTCVALFVLCALAGLRPGVAHAETSDPKTAVEPCSDAPPRVAPVLLPPSGEVSVLITGGAGYIGSHMALLLLGQTDVRYSVVVVDDLSRGDMRHIHTLRAMALAKGKEFTFVNADVGSVPLMVETMRTHNVSLVIHFAGFAYASESVTHPLRYFDNIVTKTQLLLDAMSQANVRQLVYSSSSATYGSIPDDGCDSLLHEWSPQKPLSPYGTAKLMAEQVISAYARSRHLSGEDFSAVILRYFNVIGADPFLRVGPMPKRHLSVYGRIVDSCFDAALTGQPMKLFGDDFATHDGSPIRDYIHVMDLVSAHLRLTQIVHDRQLEVYNIGIGQGFSVKELVAACQVATGLHVPTSIHPRRMGDPAVVLGDSSKLRRELGWKARYTDLAASIRTGWQWRQLVEREARAVKRQKQLTESG